jgi:hypothetical protein
MSQLDYAQGGSSSGPLENRITSISNAILRKYSAKHASRLLCESRGL